MTAPNKAEKEAQERAATILTEPPEPTSSTIVESDSDKPEGEQPEGEKPVEAIPGSPDAEVLEVVEPPPPPPSTEEILNAIKLLTSLQAQSEEVVSEGSPGDIFLCYDLCMRVHGEVPFRIQGSRQLHSILLPEGLPTATSEMETALFTIVQPIKQRLMGIVGMLTAVKRGEAPRPQIGFQK